jgi:hypothetical protein
MAWRVDEVSANSSWGKGVVTPRSGEDEKRVVTDGLLSRSPSLQTFLLRKWMAGACLPWIRARIARPYVMCYSQYLNHHILDLEYLLRRVKGGKLWVSENRSEILFCEGSGEVWR